MENSIHILNKLLDGTALRHQAISANIANVNTPGYRRKDVPFLDELKAAVETNDPATIKAVTPQVRPDRSSAPVRLEAEFAAMSQNQILYTTSADLISRKYERLRRAIRGN